MRKLSNIRPDILIVCECVQQFFHYLLCRDYVYEAERKIVAVEERIFSMTSTLYVRLRTGTRIGCENRETREHNNCVS